MRQPTLECGVCSTPVADRSDESVRITLREDGVSVVLVLPCCGFPVNFLDPSGVLRFAPLHVPAAIGPRSIHLQTLGEFMKNVAILFVVVLGLFCGAAPAALAQSAESARSTARVTAPIVAEQEPVPHLVQFSGVLKDAAARPVAGVVSVTFAIYAEQEGGAALWSETQNVMADGGGHFSVLLGAASSAGVPVRTFRHRAITLAGRYGRASAGDAALVAGQRSVRAKGRRRADARRLAGFGVRDNESLAARSSDPIRRRFSAPAETSGQASRSFAASGDSAGYADRKRDHEFRSAVDFGTRRWAIP